MECELNDFRGKGESVEQCEESPRRGGGSERDERPLLKADSSASAGSGGVSTCSESVEELERKYAPYARRDAYGVMGRGELPLREKLLLLLAFVTLVPIRFIAGMAILVIYYVICRVCTLFKDPNREDEQEDYAHMVGWRRKVVVRSGRFCSRAMLFVFGFYWIKESRLEVLLVYYFVGYFVYMPFFRCSVSFLSLLVK